MSDDTPSMENMISMPTMNREVRKGRPTEDQKLLRNPDPELERTLNADPWRVLRIMGEFVEGIDALVGINTSVAIFGSARVKPDDPMYLAAVETARLLGEAGLTIITGGGPGIMEAGNQGARDAGVKSVGLNIELPFEQGINAFVDVAVEFRYFFVRKTMFVKYAQAFIIFPGGFGTMDELFEALTLIQTGKLRNFPIILYGSAYWQGMMDWLRQTMLADGKISPHDLDLLILCDSPEEARNLVVRSIHDPNWREGQEEGARQEAQRILELPSGGYY